VRAAATGDRETIKSTTEALAADERAKKHHILADRLQRALSAVPVTPPPLTTSVVSSGGSGREAIMQVEPRIRLDDLLLPLPAQDHGRQLIEEHIRSDVLRAHGYEPRHRVLLSGPPGNGKTSYAEALAEALALPLFAVRYDALIGSYLGETNARLRRLFDYVRTQPSVLFFDEFDAIGKERGDTHETGEIKRVVSFLLMQLDHLPSYVIVIAATNHAELLDRAVWRRFQIRLAFPAPDRKHVEAFLDRVVAQWPERPRLSVQKIAGKLGSVSYAEALDFCQSVRRRHILGLGDVAIDDALKVELDLWSSRVRPEALNGERSEQTPPEVDASAARGSTDWKSKEHPRPSPFSLDRQNANFSPKFDRLAEVLQRDQTGLELRADPSGLAPERLLVFEVRGQIAPFAAAVRRVSGLELIDEEELSGDGEDKAPVAYLMVPDIRALREIESLWRRWQRDQLLQGETPWRDVFALLRDLRPWGPLDRVQPDEADILSEEIFERGESELISLEIELVYRANAQTGADREDEVRAAVVAREGRVVSRARIDDIAYHALLVELPVRAVREIIQRSQSGIAALEPVMHIRPQSIASTIDVGDISDTDSVDGAGRLGEPILALLDGVPVAAHALLGAHLVVDDQFGLVPSTPVADRMHGTAMASLIVHGDRNRPEPPLARRIHVVPVMGAGDRFPSDRLIVDLIYMAALAMRGGAEPTAAGVLIVNVSLGNRRRQFHGQLSPWARLLDRLAYRFGLLFVVSAGNCIDAFGIPAYPNSTAFEDADAHHRATETLRALGEIIADRRLLSPAETVNGLTIGAYNSDSVSPTERSTARVNVDPYAELQMTNPSSALGPGFALSVKPDILLPGAREHLRFVRNQTHIEVKPATAARFAGLKVAAPPQGGRENVDGFNERHQRSRRVGIAHRAPYPRRLRGGVRSGLPSFDPRAEGGAPQGLARSSRQMARGRSYANSFDDRSTGAQVSPAAEGQHTAISGFRLCRGG
jgi:hypothetical protein